MYCLRKLDHVVLNEASNLIYVKSVFAGSSDASPPVFYSSLHVIDIDKRERVSWLSMPSNDWEGIAYNNVNNSIYIREPKANSILKYDEFAKEKLKVIQFCSKSDAELLERKSRHGLLRRLRGWFIDYLSTGSEREAITVNPMTNKVYVSDHYNGLLWEIDG